MTATRFPTPSELLAANVRRLREAAGLRQWDVAALMRLNGFTAWVEGTEAQVESGRRRVSTDELFALSLILEAPLSELFQPAEHEHVTHVRVGDFVPSASAIRIVVGGSSSTEEGEAARKSLRRAIAFRSFRSDLLSAEETELVQDVASRLGRRPSDVANMAKQLWRGNGILMERERRVADAYRQGDIAIHRGHVMRALTAELDEALTTAGIRRQRRTRR